MREEISKDGTLLRKSSMPKLSPKVTRLLYASILLCYMLMHIDDGVLSVASESILKDLHISESQLGLVEASMYVGIIIGSLVCPFIFAKGSPKFIIICTVICNAIAVSTWSLSGNFWILSIARVLNGIFLVSLRFTLYLNM